MVYIRKNRKKLAFRACIIIFALAFLFFTVVRSVNLKLDEFIIPLARTGLTGEITRILNDAVAECLLEESCGELAETVCDEQGNVRSVRVDSLRLNLLRTEVSSRTAEKLAALEKVYVKADLSNVFNDEIFIGKLNFAFTVDIIFVGAVETDVKSEFVSAGINQTNYRLSLTIAASVTADIVSDFTVDVCTSVNLVDMLIIGDVPTVMWG